jgi:hypothetical protein
MSLMPVPRRNPETSHCEVRKSVRDSFGVPRTLEVAAVVTGVARAQRAIDELTKRHRRCAKQSIGDTLGKDFAKHQFVLAVITGIELVIVNS